MVQAAMQLAAMVLMAIWITRSSPPIWLMVVVAAIGSTAMTAISGYVSRRAAARARADGDPA